MAGTDEDFYADSRIEMRAREEGLVWLNSNFRTRMDRIRFNRFIRFHPLEVFWGLSSALLVIVVLGAGYWKFGSDGPLFFVFNPLVIFLYTVLALWNGRKLAHMSPLRRQTDEGTATWLVLQLRRFVFWVSRLVYKNAGSSNLYMTIAATDSGIPRPLEADEYIGTARAPQSPRITDPQREYDSRMGLATPEMMNIEIVQRGDPVPISGNLEAYIEAQKQQEDERRRMRKRGRNRG